MGTRQPGKQKRSVKQRLYTLASHSWTITSWIWTAIIVALVIQFIPTYLFSSASTTWEAVLNWLNNADMDFPWNALRIFAIIALPLLGGITILAWMLKRRLREESEGLDRLIEVLERDVVTPQLEDIREQIRQLREAQKANVATLSQLGVRLQQMPTPTDLKNLQTVAHQRMLAWNKEFNQVLQDIHSRTTEQVGWLNSLFQQSQRREETLSTDLHAIARILEPFQNKVEVTPLPEQPVSKVESDQVAATKLFEGDAAPLPLDLPSNAEPTRPATSEFLKLPEPGLVTYDEN